MTREEAIAFFKDMNECTYGNLEAVEMAIKALEQQSCENSIVREAERTNLLIEDCVRKLPPVQPKPKIGHWIEEFNDLEGEVKFICSSCGKYQLFETDFCYNCGSDNRVRNKE